MKWFKQAVRQHSFYGRAAVLRSLGGNGRAALPFEFNASAAGGGQTP